MKNISNHTSKMLYVAKAFAILSVITAHMSFSEAFPVLEIIRTSLGQIGVFTFFFISGYLYSRDTGDTKSYWLKKFKNLFIPWFVFSIATFALSKILYGGTKNLTIDYLKHFLGIGTAYWYMSILMIMLFVFKCFYTKKWALYLCIIISTISIVLSFTKFINYSLCFNQYLNIFNWVGVFSLGILFRQYNLLERIIGIRYIVISFVGIMLSVLVAIFRASQIEAYIDITSLFVELFGLILVLNLSYILTNSKFLCDVGKKSFFIYLMHLQVVGVINTRLPYNVFFFFLRPFIGLMVCYLISIIFKKVLDWFQLSKYNYIFGLDK